uniref:CCDC92 domain-containing protein n=1 Tax=Rhabditophanes sp. KR3021 TaxID=114890 RepID=A0AC35U7Q1_9BILA
MSSNESQAPIQNMLSTLKDLIGNLSEKNRMSDEVLKSTNMVKQKLGNMLNNIDYTDQMNTSKKEQKPDYRNGVVDRMRNENQRIYILNEERNNLRLLVQEYHYTLEMVMKKHRQIVEKIAATPNVENILRESNCALDSQCKEIQGKMAFANVCNRMIEYINEFEESQREKNKALIRLEAENKLLRELLHIQKNPFKEFVEPESYYTTALSKTIPKTIAPTRVIMAAILPTKNSLPERQFFSVAVSSQSDKMAPQNGHRPFGPRCCFDFAEGRMDMEDALSRQIVKIQMSKDVCLCNEIFNRHFHVMHETYLEYMREKTNNNSSDLLNDLKYVSFTYDCEGCIVSNQYDFKISDIINNWKGFRKMT